MKEQLIINVWDVEQDEPLEDGLEAEHRDTYPNMSGPSMNDGYVQFGCTLKDGTWLEVRIPFDMIPELHTEMAECQAVWDARREEK